MKNKTKIYSPLELMDFGFVHQYDSDIENKATPDEFSYSVFKLDLNKEAYLECTIEFDANKKQRLQYFSLQVEDHEIKKPFTIEEIKFLKKLFKN